MEQNLVWSSKTTNKSAVNLDQVVNIYRATDIKSTKLIYLIVFYFIHRESAYWHYDSECLCDQDYYQLLATYCKDISQ